MSTLDRIIFIEEWRMSSLNDEELVAKLWEKDGFHTERFTKAEKRKGKTPDFRVYQGNSLVFYCEVKSIEKDTWPEDKLAVVKPGESTGWERNPPVFNRLTDDIHTAVKQFNAVNPEAKIPNVLTFVNHDRYCGLPDLLGVLTGRFFADDGSSVLIYAKFSRGRIRKEKDRIHLFCWVEDEQFRSRLFNDASEGHYQALCRLLSVDPDMVKFYGAVNS
jgi:hypothetical protein